MTVLGGRPSNARFFRRNLMVGAVDLICRVPLVFTAGYLARQVGPATYGSWALVLAYQGLLSGVCYLALSGRRLGVDARVGTAAVLGLAGALHLAYFVNVYLLPTSG